jgi:hypothetical protein
MPAPRKKKVVEPVASESLAENIQENVTSADVEVEVETASALALENIYAAAEGAAITKIGPAQDVVVSISSMSPKTTNTIDLGTSSLKYKDAFFAGNETVGGTLAVTGVTTLTAQPILCTWQTRATAASAPFSPMPQWPLPRAAGCAPPLTLPVAWLPLGLGALRWDEQVAALAGTAAGKPRKWSRG